jgi:hypothetical protein
MKSRKEIIPALVALLNVYFFLLWIYIFNLYDSQEQRVGSFLKYWIFFKTAGELSVFLSIVTLGSLIWINFKSMKIDFFRIGISAIHIIFLLFLLWSYL